jgi:hypothetical protein
MDPRKRLLSYQLAQEMTARDVEALKVLVRDRSDRPEAANLSRAIGTLAVRDRTADTARILVSLASDGREDAVDRATAAASLRLIALPEARQGLMRLIGAPDAIVRVEVIKSLGCIGDEASLRALERAEARREGTEERQWAFAMALIAHRIGLEAAHLPFQAGVARRAGPSGDLIDLSLRPILPRTTAAERERLQGSDYGITLSERVGFALRAGRARWSVFVNGELTEGGGVFARSSRIFERPWITALLARIDERTKSSAVQYVVLSDPDEQGARIMVVRTDGELVYSGQLTMPKGLLSFMVRDVARKGTAPTNVRGRLTSRGVEFDVSIPFGRRRDTRSGESVVAPQQ